MKKLLLLMGICSILISCNQNTQKKYHTLSTLYTLNGIPISDADLLISNFLRDKKINNHMTSVLVKRSIFYSMDSLLIKQNADGMRIYFAKDSNGKDTLVFVSTFEGGVDSNDTTKRIHRDFYQRHESYFNAALQQAMTTKYGAVPGALLFLKDPQCPQNDGCDTTKPHYITCKKAYALVQSFVNPDSQNPKDTINSNSEWFDVGIINSLNAELQRSQTSGLRIYFTQCLKPDKMRVKRHSFVFIKTNTSTATPVDDYFCFTVYPKYVTKDGDNKGGIDNGEECPTNCSGVSWP